MTWGWPGPGIRCVVGELGMRRTDTVYVGKGIDRFLNSSGCENRIPR